MTGEGKPLTGPRILILMSRAGGGHRSAASALREALLQLAPEAQVPIVDLFAHLPFPLSQLGGLYEPVVQHSQGLWQLVWDLTKNPGRSARLIKVITPLITPTLRELLRSRRPDVVVSVYPLCVHALAQARRDLPLSIPQITVITDLVNIHPTWVCPEVDLCVVPTEPARQQVLRYGVPAERVRLLGLPVRPQFSACQQQKEALRAQLDLRQGLWTLLLMGGAEGVGPLFEMTCALDEADLPLQLLVVTGHNRRLRREMSAVSWEKDIHVLGFVEQVWEFMGASDLLLTKAGPQTICEGLNAGLPVLIIGALPGQEEGNANYVVSHGAGLLIPSPQALAATLDELLVSDRRRMEEMRARVQELARPRAALDVAQLILEQAGFQTSEVFGRYR
ncbi:MAG: glycosyltransferase [Chloroflexota bacterium]|nr:glycosyltransferase [Chloroflexota bacterium]